MWERNLQDLIRGLRANKWDDAKFISQAVDEIRKEVKSKDMELKAVAVLKLIYLDMLGHDTSWASFHVVEVMSSTRLHLKAIGYLAAAQFFAQDTDVLMLTVSLLKKDLSSTPADIGVALNGLSQIVTTDLARDLFSDLMSLLNHSRPTMRKRAVLTLYKAMVSHPETLEAGIARLREKLDDPDSTVIAATVNVLCELAKRCPQDCLGLAPPLFHLLTTSSNNWMLIKIVKLFACLTPHEPRLVKKLQAPLTELISTTSAISLLYECVQTCIIGGMLRGLSGDALARMCVSKLSAFIQNEDQNLKYYALFAMQKIVPSHPHLIAEYQDMIMESINDDDTSIAMRALDLVSTMVNQQNLQPIVQKLLSHLVSDAPSKTLTATQALTQYTTSKEDAKLSTPATQTPAYRLLLINCILDICSRDMYENITNFEWYLLVLVDLAHVAQVDVGMGIRNQLIDIAVRVQGIRRHAVKLMSSLISEGTMLRNAQQAGSCPEVLWAAAWICGEFCSLLAEPHKLIPHLIQPEVANLAPEIQAVCIQAATKIFGHWAVELALRWDDDELSPLKELVELIISRVKDLVTSQHIEVQERAADTLQLFSFIQTDLHAYRPLPESSIAFSRDSSADPNCPKGLYLMRPLFTSYELNPVAPNAQASVPVPEGLDLDAWIVPPPIDPAAGAGRKAKSKKGKEKEKNGSSDKAGKRNGKHKEGVDHVIDSLSAEEQAQREKRKMERIERMRDDPYYIVDDPPSKVVAAHDVDTIPIVRLDESLPLPKKPDHPQLASFRASTVTEQYKIDKEGEMPAEALTRSASVSRPSTPSHVGRQNYAADNEVKPITPQPIKVTKAKKKGSSSKLTRRHDPIGSNDTRLA